MPPYQPTDPVTDLTTLRDVMPPPHADQQTKIIDHIDPLITDWLAATTFAVLSTADSKGRIDASPKGDPAGFIKVIDSHTIAIPDRPGNHRYDSFSNIFDTGRAGLVCLVPNRNEVVRINGRACVIRDAPILTQLAINDRIPDFAVLLHVEEAFFHCGKAIIRSHLWSKHPPAPAHLPTYAAALTAQAAPTSTPAELAARLDNNDRNRLYDE